MELLAGTPNYIARAYFRARAALAGGAAHTREHHQRLAGGVAVPIGAGAQLKSDNGAARAPSPSAGNGLSMRTVPVEYEAGPLIEGLEPLRVMFMFFPKSLMDTLRERRAALLDLCRRALMATSNLNDLVALLTVARERSFTRAAVQLGVSQSSLSRTVTALERRMGMLLLNCTTQSVSPTEAELQRDGRKPWAVLRANARTMRQRKAPQHLKG